MLHLWGNRCVTAGSNREPGALRLSRPSMTTIATTNKVTEVRACPNLQATGDARRELTSKAREDADDTGEAQETER